MINIIEKIIHNIMRVEEDKSERTLYYITITDSYKIRVIIYREMFY